MLGNDVWCQATERVPSSTVVFELIKPCGWPRREHNDHTSSLTPFVFELSYPSMTIVKTALRPCIRQFLITLGQPRAFQTSLSIRSLHASCIRTTNHRPTSLTNILASEVPPPVQVASVSTAGIKLADGLVFSGPVVFLEGKVFLWDVPNGGFTTSPNLSMGMDMKKWDAWSKGHWSIFEVVVPRPGRFCYLLNACAYRPSEILVFGTGARMEFVPPRIRSYTRELGIQLEVMDTVSPPRRSYTSINPCHRKMRRRRTTYLRRKGDELLRPFFPFFQRYGIRNKDFDVPSLRISHPYKAVQYRRIIPLHRIIQCPMSTPCYQVL